LKSKLGAPSGTRSNGQGQIASERDQHRLVTARHPRITQKPRAQDHAVGNEPGERTGALPPPSDEQSDDEERVEEHERAKRDQEPEPAAHLARLTRDSLVNRSGARASMG